MQVKSFCWADKLIPGAMRCLPMSKYIILKIFIIFYLITDSVQEVRIFVFLLCNWGVWQWADNIRSNSQICGNSWQVFWKRLWARHHLQLRKSLLYFGRVFDCRYFQPCFCTNSLLYKSRLFHKKIVFIMMGKLCLLLLFLIRQIIFNRFII